MGVKVKGRLGVGVKERNVRLEQAWARSRHAVVLKTRDFIVRARCALRLLEEREQRQGREDLELKELNR